MNYIKRLIPYAFIALLLSVTTLWSGTITKPNTFVSGTPTNAAAMNENFDTIYSDYNGNISSVNILDGGIGTADLGSGIVTAAKLAADAHFSENVKAYGATGNGTTNDTTAFANAISYCKTNKKILYVPEGTYLTNITIERASGESDFNFYLQGAGYNSIIKAADNTKSTLIMKGYNTSTMLGYGSIRDIAINGNAITDTPVVDIQYTTRVDMKGVKVTNGKELVRLSNHVYDSIIDTCFFTSPVADASTGKALYLKGEVNYITIKDTKITTSSEHAYGIYISADTHTDINGWIRILNNAIEGYKYAITAVKTRGLIVEGNHIEGGDNLTTDFIGINLVSDEMRNPIWLAGTKILNNTFWSDSAVFTNFIYINMVGYSARADAFDGWVIEGNYFGKTTGTYCIRFDADVAHKQKLIIGKNFWHGTATTDATINPASVGLYTISDGVVDVIAVDTAVGTSDISTNSTSYVDMTDMSYTDTFTAGNVEVKFIAGCEFGGTTNLWVKLLKDDIEVDTLRTRDDIIDGAVILTYIGYVTAGSHTFKVQWKVEADTVNQYGATVAPRKLWVIRGLN